MNNHIQIYLVATLLAFLVSCKGQDRTDQPENDIKLLGSEGAHIISHTKVDTIYANNAPSRITRKIRKNREGGLIMAAFDEVILYDGESFSKIPKMEGFESMDVFDALEDSKGNYWIGSTHYGVFCYDGEGFIHFTTDNGLVNNRTIDIYEGKSGNIWIATLGGASLYNGKSFRNFTTKDGLASNDVNTIIEDRKGQIWFGTRGSVSVFDGKTFTTITREQNRAFENVRHIIEDKKGNIWLGGKDGLWRFDGKTFANFSQEFAAYIYEDKNGNIWTTSESSGSRSWVLSVYENTSSNEQTHVTEVYSQKGMLFGLSEDNEGNIWVGTLQGVFNYDGKSINYFMNK